MRNEDFNLISNVHKFRKKIDSYARKRYNLAKNVLVNNGIEFEDFQSEIWFGISQCESEKPDSFYMQVAKCDANNIIDKAGRAYIDTLLYDDDPDTDEESSDDYCSGGIEKPVYNPRNFIAVCQTLGGHIHIAASYATRQTACGQKWRYDVAADVPDDIECPKCREAYFANVKLV
jgi:hypothetical protein